jgi:hypothetical protein
VPYHVRITSRDPLRCSHDALALDKDAAWIEAEVVAPRREGRDIFIDGQVFSRDSIDEIHITETDQTSDQACFISHGTAAYVQVARPKPSPLTLLPPPPPQSAPPPALPATGDDLDRPSERTGHGDFAEGRVGREGLALRGRGEAAALVEQAGGFVGLGDP